MSLRVLFFGRLREAAGGPERLIDPPPDIDSVRALRAWLDDGALEAVLSQPGVRVAVDQRFAALEAPLAGVREVAFMAPLSGG